MEVLPEIQINEQIEETPLKAAFRFNAAKLGEVVKALAKARKNFGVVKKSAENPLYKDVKGKSRKYADLNEIVTATAEALADEGLVIIQAPFMDGKNAGMVTSLMHESGGWIECTISGCPAFQRLKEGGERFDAQTVGIAITYLARYGEGRILNLSAEDDDGNSLVAPKEEKPKAFVPASAATYIESKLPTVPGKTIQTFSSESEPAYLLPTKEEAASLAARLKALGQDSRLLKNYVQAKSGKPWNETAKGTLENIVVLLETAHKEGKLSDLLKESV